MNIPNILKKKDPEPIPPEVLDAYEQAKTQRRIENAKTKGIQDADKIFNYQPLYKKLLNGGKWLLQDLSEGAANTRPEVFFNMDDEQPRRRRKRR